MEQKPIMIFHIVCDRQATTTMDLSNGGRVKIIPFGGTVESELFTGKILPGAADIQVTNAAGVRHMCAKYMFEGVDQTGTPCHLYVENNGYFERDHAPKPFEATPTFKTDSKALESYLMGEHFRAEGHSQSCGPDIYIFDTNQK